MAKLRQNRKTGRLILKSFFRGIGRYCTQTLNTDGEQRLLRAGLAVGQKVGRWLLAKLEEHGEVFPPVGVFNGQLTLDIEVKLSQRPTPKPVKKRKKLPKDQADPAQLTFPFESNNFLLRRAA